MLSNIAFDLDGVLYNWHLAAHTYLRVYKGIKESFEEFWRNPFELLSVDEIKYIATVPELYEKFIPSKDLLDMLHNLSEEYTLYYLTNRPISVENLTSRWLKRYGFPQDDNLIFTTDKGKYIRLLEIDLIAEDGGHDGKVAISLKGLTDVILIRRPWNEKVWNQFITINSVLELPKLIDELYNKDYEDLLITQRESMDISTQ